MRMVIKYVPTKCLFRYVIILLLGFVTQSMLSQISPMSFEYLDISNGLPHNTVFCIIQDRFGFMWIGTQDGLLRYDGQKAKVYSNSSNKDFPAKNIQSLLEYPSSDMYIGTRGQGLIVKSGITGKFEPLPNKSLNDALATSWIKSLYMDSNQRIWICTLGDGLWMFDPRTGDHKSYQIDNSILNSNQVSSVVEDKEGHIWIASSSDQLFYVDVSSNELALYKSDTQKFYGFRKVFYKDKSDRLWLGTEGYGLYLLVKGQQSWRHFTTRDGLPSNIITSIKENISGQLLIATDGGGLYVLDPNTGLGKIFDIYEGREPMNTNALYHICIDHDQNVWIGTYNGGINIHKEYKTAFETYDKTDSNPGSMLSILSISGQKTKKYWLGTDGSGVYEFDPSTKKLVEKNSYLRINPKIIKSIYEDKDQQLWLSSYNDGLYQINLKTKQKKHYHPDAASNLRISGRNVWSIAEDNDDHIWIGMLGAGLNKIDKVTGKISQYTYDPSDNFGLSGNVVMNVLVDDHNDVWVGTNTAGLSILNQRTDSFTRLIHDPTDGQSISSNDIRCIFMDSKKRIWIGTESGGLNRWMGGAHFKHYTTKDGLVSNAVMGIQEDAPGHIWISSFKGISRLDEKNNTIYNYNFHQDSPFDINQFNMASMASDSTMMAFGGIHGLTVFYPERIKLDKPLPKVYFTDFKIFNKEVDSGKVYSNTYEQNCNIDNVEIIDISYAEHTFSLEFISIDYADPQSMVYEYMMDGFDQSWLRTTSDQREVTYTNLNPGTYIFSVRASNSPGIWGPEKSITVIVRPLFWQTWWFKLFLGIFFLGVVYQLLKVYSANREMALKQTVLESNEAILTLTNEKLGAQQEVLTLTNEKLEMELLNKNSDLMNQTAKIAHKNEVLIDIKRELAHISASNEASRNKMIRNLGSLVDMELEDKKNWDKFQQYFDQINHNFRTNLLQKHPNLSQNDLLMCTITHLNLSNKEMALLLNLSISGIEKSRYRLKKKLQLQADDDLNTYLRGF
ncbi:MAG: two-component regulator propeller domain-containing protein [Saprospiraceae bacterium]